MLNHRKSLRAYSMVEILVALAILVVGGYGIYDRFIDAGRQARRLETRIEANLLAHQQLATLQACSFESLEGWTPPANPQALPGNLQYIYQPSVERRDDQSLALSVWVGWDTTVDQGFVPGQSLEVEGIKVR